MPQTPRPTGGSTAPLLIRADAGGELGTGHVMRMLALAQAWMAEGGHAVIALLSCPEALIERLKTEGLEIRLLEGSPRGSGDDAGELIGVARNVDAGWIVLDGYDFGLDYQRQLKHAEFKLMVMDDYGHCNTWCADLILNQNLGTESRIYDNEITDAKTLLGPNYVLLRKEFWNIIPKKLVPGQSIRNLLITLGGVDADNITGKVLEALENTAAHDLSLRVIIGPGNPHLSVLKDIGLNSRHKIIFLQNVTDMPSQYHWADGVISAGGSTCYEWMRFGLPAVVIQIAENQADIYQRLINSQRAVGLGIIAGESPELNIVELASWLKGHISGDTSQHTVDGSGGHRVCGSMLHAPFYVRIANVEDSQAFYDLANDSVVRRWSLNPKPFSWQSHIRWFTKKLKDSTAVILCVCDQETNQFAGYVRFEKGQDQDWLISYALEGHYRGQGFGKMVLEKGMRYLEYHLNEKQLFTGYVHQENIPSKRIFESIGFKEQNNTLNMPNFITYTHHIS
ncbi:MAG: UDP-2,4-diacetamido-2,4,6-trideoxy-beta-L-altropyranose hydrolase [Kiritimatiellae bacterium]|jgi:UDP-2,4-diacetamido-2,4,6-trideoxy-beta-L-altropyranose hydrolase|nr:UDP-2,4-diacetamido-2,4,6-trideoxy-beta-L-altropyranose hydrolase [Kiritimatiellia bacterium]